MQKSLAVSIIVLVVGSSDVAAAAQPRPPRERVALAAAAFMAAQGDLERPPAPLSTLRRNQLLPGMLPGLELSIERTPFFRQVHLPLVEFWGGRLRVGYFSRIRPADFFAVPAVSGTGPTLRSVTLAPRPDASYGMRLSIQFGREAAADDLHTPRRCAELAIGFEPGCRH